MAHGGERSELAIQTLIRSRARILCPAVRLIAIPNGGKRTQWQARQALREGLTSGAPDMVALWPNGGVAWIEVKAEKGRVSKSQAEFHEMLERYGHRICVARSPEEALAFLAECGAPFVGRIAA